MTIILYILCIHVNEKTNMDYQDEQDKQDETLLPGKLTPAMIRCGIADAQDCKRVVS